MYTEGIQDSVFSRASQLFLSSAAQHFTSKFHKAWWPWPWPQTTGIMSYSCND